MDVNALSNEHRITRAALRALGAIRKLVSKNKSIRRMSPEELRRLEHILVVNMLPIGDSILAMPAIRLLRQAAPQAKFTLFTTRTVEPLFAAEEAVDATLTDESVLRGNAFNLALVLDTDFRGSLIAWRAGAERRVGYDCDGTGYMLTDAEPAPDYWLLPVSEYPSDLKKRHRVEAWLHLVEALGADVDPPDPPAPRLTLTERAIDFAERFWKFHGATGDRPRVILHPGASKSRRWRQERFAELADALVERHGAVVAVTGSRQDKILAEWICDCAEQKVIDATGHDLDESAALIGSAHVAVSVDTCATHIADALGTPCVALFGAEDPDIWRPYGEAHIVIRSEDCGCLGCKLPECPREDHICMDSISTDTVLAAVEGILEKRDD